MRYPTSLLPVLTLITTTANAKSILPTLCYIKTNNVTEQNTRGPCGLVTPESGFASCCGIGDICLTDGICHNTKQKKASLASGYYVGGCTDPSLEDSSCLNACGDLSRNSVVYNATADEWKCCGTTNGIVNCDSPTNETFSAPPLAQLKPTYTVAASGASATSTSTSTSSQSAESSSRLSGGAKAGIAVGVIVGVLTIGGMLGFFIVRRRRKFRYAETQNNDMEMREDLKKQNLPSDASPLGVGSEHVVSPNHPGAVEKDSEGQGGHPARLELQGSRGAHAELPVDGRGPQELP